MISVRLRDPITWSWSCELFFKVWGPVTSLERMKLCTSNLMCGLILRSTSASVIDYP